MFPHKNKKPNAGKVGQKNTASHCGIQRSCVLSMKLDYLERRHKSHSNENYITLSPYQNKNYLYRRLFNNNAAVDQFYKTEK